MCKEIQNGMACDYCDATKKDVGFFIGASLKQEWTMWHGTGKISCPDCYDRGKKESANSVSRNNNAA